nr:MAG TPA: hypothetical protein [Caudoviricetes sp.]DAM02047.1 MAG TPA: hypothetical protein [Caudoviricetes sp.]DAM16387.1 MAG TPA: hypothetical protein [Caudoviricetes sp.]DAM28984.1 MAG TPA: hypothetical protein [Caudoviricetes sp.]DAN11870.1 MAG TPA: hypothetical protein [Caudoviricetes sp.]
MQHNLILVIKHTWQISCVCLFFLCPKLNGTKL